MDKNVLRMPEVRAAAKRLDLDLLGEFLDHRPAQRDMVVNQVWMHALVDGAPVSRLNELEAWTQSRGTPRPKNLFPMALSSNNAPGLAWLLDHHDWKAGRFWKEDAPGPTRHDLTPLADSTLALLQQHWHEKTSVFDAAWVLIERFPDLFAHRSNLAQPIRAPQLLDRAFEHAVAHNDPAALDRAIRWMAPLRAMAPRPPQTSESFSQCWYDQFVSQRNSDHVTQLYNLSQSHAGLRETLADILPSTTKVHYRQAAVETNSMEDYLLATASPAIVDLMDLASAHPIRVGLLSAISDDAIFSSFLSRASSSSPGLLYRMVSRHPEVAKRFIEYRNRSGGVGLNAVHVMLEARADESLKQPWVAMDRWILSNASVLLSEPFPSGEGVREFCESRFPSFSAKLRRNELMKHVKSITPLPSSRPKM